MWKTLDFGGGVCYSLIELKKLSHPNAIKKVEK